MTVAPGHANSSFLLTPARPRFGGIFWRIFGASNALMVNFAGKRWNPVFAVVEHVGRRSGRVYRAPVAARRVDGGFVISLAFGAQVDWHRNLLAAQAGTILWRGREYAVGAPQRLDLSAGIAAFHAVQRFFLHLARIDGYIRVDDAEPAA